MLKQKALAPAEKVFQVQIFSNLKTFAIPNPPSLSTLANREKPKPQTKNPNQKQLPVKPPT